MTDEDTGQRQEKRDSLFLSATVSVGEGRPFETRVRNLSPGGMMIDAPNEMLPGTQLVADMRGVGSVNGRIAWHSQGRAGVAFDTDIDPRLARTGGTGPKTVAPDYLRNNPPSRRSGLAIR